MCVCSCTNYVELKTKQNKNNNDDTMELQFIAITLLLGNNKFEYEVLMIKEYIR